MQLELVILSTDIIRLCDRLETDLITDSFMKWYL